MIVVHLIHTLGIFVPHTIRITSLVRVIDHRAEAHRPVVIGTPLHAHTRIAFFERIGRLIGEFVFEISITFVPTCRERNTPTIVERGLSRQVGREVIVIAVAQAQTRACAVERRECLHIHNAANGIATIECALCTAQHFDATYIVKNKIKSSSLKVGHTIYIKTSSWGFGFRTYATNVERSILLAPVIGHIEVGHYGSEVFERAELMIVHQ